MAEYDLMHKKKYAAGFLLMRKPAALSVIKIMVPVYSHSLGMLT